MNPLADNPAAKQILELHRIATDCTYLDRVKHHMRTVVGQCLIEFLESDERPFLVAVTWDEAEMKTPLGHPMGEATQVTCRALCVLAYGQDARVGELVHGKSLDAYPQETVTRRRYNRHSIGFSIYKDGEPVHESYPVETVTFRRHGEHWLRIS